MDIQHIRLINVKKRLGVLGKNDLSISIDIRYLQLQNIKTIPALGE
jgi:hypothetical protein